MNRRVVVTGVGAVTPRGNDAPSTWQALAEGRSGVGQLTSIDTTGFEVTIAGEVKDFTLADVVPGSVGLRHLLRPGTFGVGASRPAGQSTASTSSTPCAPPGTILAPTRHGTRKRPAA